VNLKALARPYTTPEGVVLYFIPYQTLLVSVAVDEMEKVQPDANEWNIIQQTFTLCLPLVADIEFTVDMPLEYQGLQAYWQNRNGDFRANYDLYTQLLSVDMCTTLWNGYHATRDQSIAAAPELGEVGESADPE